MSVDPVIVVGTHRKHAELWSKTHIQAWYRMPILVHPENMESAFRGMRDRVILILEEAYIPEPFLNLIASRNTIIDLNQR
jgi:hypothetical protein